MKNVIAKTTLSESCMDIELYEADGMYTVRAEQRVYGWEECEFDTYDRASNLYVNAVAAAVTGGDPLSLVGQEALLRHL